MRRRWNIEFESSFLTLEIVGSLESISSYQVDGVNSFKKSPLCVVEQSQKFLRGGTVLKQCCFLAFTCSSQEGWMLMNRGTYFIHIISECKQTSTELIVQTRKCSIQQPYLEFHLVDGSFRNFKAQPPKYTSGAVICSSKYSTCTQTPQFCYCVSAASRKLRVVFLIKGAITNFKAALSIILCSQKCK